VKNNKVHIANIQDLFQEIKKVKSAEQKKVLVQVLNDCSFEDEALKGAIYFLRDSDWDFEFFLDQENRLYKKNPLLRRKTFQYISLLSFKFAAILLIPVSIGLFFILKNQNSIDKFYLEEPGLPTYMNSTNENNWEEAMVYFKSGVFEDALHSLEAINNHEYNDTASYFIAVSLYELKKYPESINFFSSIIEKSRNSIFHSDATFRMGFAFYKAGMKEKAASHFKELSLDSTNPYSKEAQKIIENVF
jgi:tetratricopeptide (TPR) repeat protein